MKPNLAGFKAPRKTLFGDLFAGLVMALVSIPGGLANGVLAGVNPLFGLYSMIAGTTVAALFTSSVIMNVDSTSATAPSALEAMGEPAVIPLQQMLASSPDATARGHAAEALGWIGSPTATAALVQALEDSDSAVRARTAWALGELAAPKARAALERAQARDPSLVVRQAAGQALTQIEGQPAVRTSLHASWALALSRWDRLLTPVLWGLILALSMLAAALLWIVGRERLLAPVA
jgi:HEAT repeat protein